MTRPTKDNLVLPDDLAVTWDRGTTHEGGEVIIYGWITRNVPSSLNGRTHEFLTLQFDHAGRLTWWYTSSASWSARLWEFFEEPGPHNACLPWDVAMATEEAQ